MKLPGFLKKPESAALNADPGITEKKIDLHKSAETGGLFRLPRIDTDILWRALVSAGLLLFFALLQTTIFARFRPFGAVPDLMLPLVIAVGMTEREKWGAVYGVIAAFVTICFGRLIYKYSPNPVQSILYHFGLLYFTFHFSALKQSIAMAILMLAFDGIIEKKPVKFIFLVLLAGQFHFPAMIFLPAYWIAKIKPGRAYLLLLAGLLVVTFVFRNQIINFLIKYYKDHETNIDLSDVTFLRTKALIMIVIVAAAVVFRVPTAEDRQYVILLQICGIAIAFQTFCGYNNIFERLADYYFQFAVIFIPMVFDKNADRRSLLSWRFMQTADTFAPYLFCGFGIYRFLNVVRGDWHLSPFKFFFQ